MLEHRAPSLPLPEPLRGADLGTFAHTSVAVRLPEIGRRIIAENDFSVKERQQLEALVAEIATGKIRFLRDDLAGDETAWQAAIQPYAGMTWLEAPWFFVETYFYRRVLEATGYFRPGPNRGLDPYQAQKFAGMEAAAGQIPGLCKRQDNWLGDPSAQKHLGAWLQVALWGNQADLSMWPAGSDQNGPESGHAEARLVIDDTRPLASHLASMNKSFHLVLDNAGFELIGDLALVDALLALNLSNPVVLHVKWHPTFVSDVTATDVHQAIAALQQNYGPESTRMANRLVTSLEAGRLQITAPWFWNSPHPLWKLPAELSAELATASLVLLKGDANYRRALGDLHWSAETPIAGILSYRPAPLALLRVLKAEVVAGLRPGQAAELSGQDPDWMIDGRWGMVQFCK